MKPRLSLRSLQLTCSFLLFAAASAFAFEGKVDMTIRTEHKEGEMPITYLIKGAMMRMDMGAPAAKSEKTEQIEKKKKGKEAPTGAVIFNQSTQEMTILMPQQKMYMVHKTNAQTGGSTGKPEHAPIEFKPTGRKEKIAGVQAEEYVGISEGKQTEVWTTKEMGKFMMANPGQGGGFGGKGAAPKSSAWEKFMQQGDFFALRVIQREKVGGPETLHMETTKIDRTSLPDTLFAPPSDFKKFEMPNMGDALRGMIPGGER